MPPELEPATEPRPQAAAAPPSPACCAVLVHYRCADDLLRCVAELREREPGLAIVVVENGSADASVARLRDAPALRSPAVELLEQADNRGFGAGCNAGIEWALAAYPRLEHVLLLNPDTVPGPDLVAALRATAQRHPDAAIVGGRILSLDGADTLFENGRFRPWTLTRSHVAAPSRAREYATEFVTGALMLVDAAELRDGLRFDERFFLYGEDMDLCRAVLARGRSLWINRDACVRHREGGSQRHEPAVLGGLRPTQLHHLTRGKVLLARKWLGPLQRAGFLLVAAAIKPVVGLLMAGPRFLPHYFAGLVAGLRAPAATDPVRRPAAVPSDSRIAVVVLTWNGREDTLRCLASLLPECEAGDRVLVVDNGSDDGTEAAVRAAFAGVEMVQNGANLGFAGGNNAGLQRALRGGCGFVWLLNNDTVVEPGTLAALRARATARPGVAALQPLLVRADDPATIDSAGHVLGRWSGVRDLAAGEPVAVAGAERREIFGACGAAALLRADALATVGLLDEELFVLFEDVDLMFRLRCAGFTAELVPDLRVRHARGVSAGRAAAAVRRRRAFWVQRNSVALALRWWPGLALVAAAPLLLWRALRAAMLGGAERRTCWPLWRGSWRMRRGNRAAMRRRGIDRWFGARPLGRPTRAARSP